MLDNTAPPRYTLCSAATVCADADACAPALSSDELALICLIVFGPTVLVLAVPFLSARMDRRARAEVASGGLEAYLVAEGGFRRCTANGMIAVLAFFVIAFDVTYFSLLLDAHPCATALGECGSISCACGLYDQGYVFMFVLLVLFSTYLVKEFSSLPPGRLRVKTTLVLASLLCALTGIFPEVEFLDPASPRRLAHDSYVLHALGLFLGPTTIVVITFTWFAAVAPHAGFTSRLRLALRAATLAALLVLDALAAAFHHTPDSTNLCGLIADANHCDTWGALPPPRCAALARAAGARTHHVHQYTCCWINGTMSADEVATLPPAYVAANDGECRRRSCTLFAFAASTALEFACLLLSAFYIGFYAIPDAHALARATATPAEADSLLGSPAYRPYEVGGVLTAPLHAPPPPPPPPPDESGRFSAYSPPPEDAPPAMLSRDRPQSPTVV